MRNPLRLARMGWDWLVHGRGPLTIGAGQVGGAACTKYANGGRPDIQFNVMPLSVDKPGDPLHRFSGFTASMWQCHPVSRGRLAIRSADPFDVPLIEPRYLSAELDRKVVVEGVKMLREIYVIGRPFAICGPRKCSRALGATMRTSCGSCVRTAAPCSTPWHLPHGHRPACGGRSEPAGARDRGLRVIDASVMPTITSANTNAPTLMIAERGASLLLGER